MAKREKEEESGTYEFPMPKFDERAFMRREREAAYVTFLAVGVGAAAGVLARLVEAGAVGAAFPNFLMLPTWGWGWVPIVAAIAVFGRLLAKLGYSEEQTKPKAMFGNGALILFTGLAVWVILHNEPFNAIF